MDRHRSQIVYLSHGGGPLPLLADPSHSSMISFMEELSNTLKTPEAVVLISAHWEEEVPTLLGSEHPPMLYDYYGFPEEAYKIQYPAPGNPALAKTIQKLLAARGISSSQDQKRGFDHGMFIPMKMLFPRAHIPTIQLSLIKGLDASAHLELGRALAPLKEQNVLIIGSGFSFHNMRAFTMDPHPAADPQNDSFQDWLIEQCCSPISARRETALEDWVQAPGARYCHPWEEHLLPLHVCTALAGTPAKVIFDDAIAGKRALAFLWE